MSTTDKAKEFLQKPGRTFFALWLPILFSMIAEPLTGLVDTAFIARLGAEPLAALGVGTVVLTGGLWSFNFLSVGSQTEISQAAGRQDLERGRRIGSLALLLATFIGIILVVVAIVLAPQLASLMGASQDVLDFSVTYIRIRALGGPAVLLTMTGFGILYGLADMKSPLIIAVVINMMNIILDWIFIFGMGAIPPLGIGGAAAASSISQWLGGVWCCLLVYRKLGFTLEIKISDLWKLLSIGRDMVMRTGALILFLLLGTRAATKLGADAGAAHQAIRQVWIFTSLFLDAAAVSAQSLIGYFYGGGNIIEARKVARLVSFWSVIIGISLLAIMMGGSSLISSILVPPESRALFYPAWIVAAVFQPIAALAFVTDGIHWGTGDFKFLRNIVILATLCGSLGIILAEMSGRSELTLIWWITGFWILLRAVFGVLRIWPGMKGSPLHTSA